MSRGVDPPNHTLNSLQHPRISIPHTHRCHRQHTQDCPGQGRGFEMFGTMGKKLKLNNTSRGKAFSVSTLFQKSPSALSLGSLQNEQQSVYLHFQSRDACESKNGKTQ